MKYYFSINDGDIDVATKNVGDNFRIMMADFDALITISIRSILVVKIICHLLFIHVGRSSSHEIGVMFVRTNNFEFWLKSRSDLILITLSWF